MSLDRVGSFDEFLPADRIRWGASLVPLELEGGQTFTNGGCHYDCPDTTGSKHDIYGHGTLVAAIAAGNPSSFGGVDADGFSLGIGVAPSAGIVVTKVAPGELVPIDPNSPNLRDVTDVTTDARTAQNAYWQNFSMNQYFQSGTGTSCTRMYDGLYSWLSRDFDNAVLDADPTTVGLQPITLTVSSGNSGQQTGPCNRVTVDRTLTLPPATAKNVISVGGAENVRAPGSPLCAEARSDSYDNLAFNAKHGTATPCWYKPDLIAVASNITSLLTNDKLTGNGFCGDTVGSSIYLPSTGTSFAAPVALGAAALASRRFHSDPSASSPALVKAMLIAGAKSMRDGNDRAGVAQWKPSANYSVPTTSNWSPTTRVIPTTPNGQYYEPEQTGGSQAQSGSTEPNWSLAAGGGYVDEWPVDHPFWIRWRHKGQEPKIAAFPNGQQGFGRIHLGDVLSDYPSRAYVNNQNLTVGTNWTGNYTAHDPALPVRIALVWSDPVGVPQSGGTQPQNPPSPLLNHLNLSAEVIQNGNCAGRYVGNALGATEESIWNADCLGAHDTKNNAEVIRFFPTTARGDTTFTVKVAFASGSQSQQPFSLVVWNAYPAGATPPPGKPAGFSATATSGSTVAVSWGASQNATTYELQRNAGAADPYVTIATFSATSHIDGGRSSNTTFLYRVRARNATGDSDWAIDPATTILFTDPVLSAQSTEIRTAHVEELRNAIGAARSAAGLSIFTWTDDPLASQVTAVKAAHFIELRSALNAARSALGLSEIMFTDGSLAAGGTVVKEVHIQELRGGVQ